MTDLTKIREAVEGIKKQYAIDEEHQVNDWLQTLLDTAEKVINAKMPEKIYRQNSQHLTSGDWWACNFCGAMGPCKCANVFNEAIDAWFAIVKVLVHWAELEELVVGWMTKIFYFSKKLMQLRNRIASEGGDDGRHNF
jgi:hypothetical protein